jgi:hypothetical protein
MIRCSLNGRKMRRPVKLTGQNNLADPDPAANVTFKFFL